MKILTARRKLTPPTLEAIRSFEESSNLLLPESLKGFLLNYNFIDTLENLFVADTGDVYYLDVFYPFTTNYDLSLQVVSQTLRHYFQDKYLAFANDSGGWQYVIGVSEDVKGQVFFCRMDSELPNSLTKLTSTLDGFIDRLQES